MKPGQLEAAVKVSPDFAIWPTVITAAVPYEIDQLDRRPRYGSHICPSGLLKATVLETDVRWDEELKLDGPCGTSSDLTYTSKHRNGQHVEFEFDAYKKWRAERFGKQAGFKQVTLKGLSERPYVEVVSRDGVNYVRMIVSRKVIIVPWDDYAKVEAKRREEEVASAQREARLDAVAQALGSKNAHFRYAYHHNEGEYDYEVETSHGSNFLVGEVTLSLPQAEKIAQLIEGGGASL